MSAATKDRWLVLVGRVLSVLPVLVMVFGATTKLTLAPQFTEPASA